MIEPDIVLLTHFLGLVIFAPLATDKLDRLVTKYYRRRVRLHTDNQVDKPFPRLVLLPGVFFAVIGLAVETLLFVFGCFGDSHPYDWMSSQFSWWFTQLVFITIFLGILVHAVTYPRRWTSIRPTNPGAFLQIVGLIIFTPLAVSLESYSWYSELYWYREMMGTKPGESLEATATVALSWTQPALGTSLLMWETVARQAWKDIKA